MPGYPILVKSMSGQSQPGLIDVETILCAEGRYRLKILAAVSGLLVPNIEVSL